MQRKSWTCTSKRLSFRTQTAPQGLLLLPRTFDPKRLRQEPAVTVARERSPPAACSMQRRLAVETRLTLN